MKPTVASEVKYCEGRDDDLNRSDGRKGPKIEPITLDRRGFKTDSMFSGASDAKFLKRRILGSIHTYMHWKRNAEQDDSSGEGNDIVNEGLDIRRDGLGV